MTVFQKTIACSDVYGNFCINGYWCIVRSNLKPPAYSDPSRLIHLEEFSNPPLIRTPSLIWGLRLFGDYYSRTELANGFYQKA